MKKSPPPSRTFPLLQKLLSPMMIATHSFCPFAIAVKSRFIDTVSIKSRISATKKRTPADRCELQVAICERPAGAFLSS